MYDISGKTKLIALVFVFGYFISSLTKHASIMIIIWKSIASK